MRFASSIGLGQKHVSRTRTRPKDNPSLRSTMKAIHVVRSFNYEQEKSKRRPFARHVYDRAESCLSRELLCHYDVFPMTTAHRSLWFTNLLRTNNILRPVSLPRLPWPASFLSNGDLFFQENWFLRKIAVEDREATDSAIRSLKKCKYQNLLKVLAGNLKIQPMDAWRDGNVINENEKWNEFLHKFKLHANV